MTIQYALDKTRKDISTAIAETVREEYDIDFENSDAELEVPKTQKMGELAFATQSAARRAKTTPPDLASQLAVTLEDEEIAMLSKVEHVGPYVNFKLSDEFYNQATSEALAMGNNYGPRDTNKGKTAIVEYSAPNTGKPMHFGHIRSTILGDAAKRLLASQGYKTIAMNYLGDSGSHVAELLVALKTFKDLPEVKTEQDLLQYYIKIKKEIDAKPELKKQAEELQAAFEKGDTSVAKEIQKIWALSTPAFNANYELLGVKFDETLGESAFVKQALDIAKEAQQKKVAVKEKDGSVVVKLEKQKLQDKVLLRANGTTLYFSRDLALADYKWNKYKFDTSYIFTAQEQNLHFKQLQKTLELLGRPYFARYKHVGFGLINLPEGKMSTREGRVVLLQEVLSQTIDEAKRELKKRQKEEKSAAAKEATSKYSEEDLDKIAFEVGLGSLKFGVLRVAAEKNIVFDTKKIVSFEGDTGAYVQYSAVRCRKIIAKSKLSKIQVPNERKLNDFEKRLSFTIARYPEVLASAANSVTAHTICEYALELASAFSSFYENCPVLQAPDDKTKLGRLALVKATQNTLENALDILGISVPEKM
ncbi:MAG TPA: arginine--tRNA ligase [Candidatus Norongarragalinales archaeon]|jgi:arginyl-tRNA synthetase|nr:arginine--tRNA ligase [Candidatus Norongarragalinales archaeon]